MSERYPELLFVAGPQKGQRIRLSRPVTVLGRGGGADVLLTEEYVSRRHARYELLQAGPTFENLSPRGTWINGRRYKSGKKVLLETGDVLGMGTETQMLFVAAGDDPEKALTAFEDLPPERRSAFGRKGAAAAAPPGTDAAAPAPLPLPGALGEAEVLPGGRDEKRPSEMSPAEREQVEKKAKRKRLLTGLAVWWGVFLVVVLVAWMFLDVDPAREVAEKPILTPAEIRQNLRARLKRTPNPLQKERKLREALGLHQQFGLNPHHLHQIVCAFKEAQAYGGRSFLDSSDHEQIYSEALDELTEVVQKKYRRACILEKNKDWQLAEDEFHRLLAIVGDRENPVFRNVKGHYGRVKFYREKSKPKRKKLWQ